MTATHTTTRREFLGRAIGAGAAGLVAPCVLTSQARASANADDGKYEIGIYTRPWDKHDYRVALDAIAEAGFKHAGLMTTTMPSGRLVISTATSEEEAVQVGEEVKKRGLDVPSVYGGGIRVSKSLEDGIADVRKLIDNCVAAGAKSLLMGGIGREDLYQRYYKAIAECCDYAAEKGVPITVKPHGGLNATGAQCRQIIERVGHDNFTLWYDPGNVFFYSKGKIDPVDDAARVDGLVHHGMCVKDFDMTRRKGGLAPDVLVTPGKGKVDFRRVMSALIKGGFRGGDLVIETLAPGDGSLQHLAAEAKAARRFLSGLIESL